MAGGKGIPHIAANLCKGCGICVFVCPEAVLGVDDGRVNAKGYHPAAVRDAERCIACISCALMCPDTAITIERFSRAKGG